MTLKTSWTDSQLEQLFKPDNHKIDFDGYQYVWFHKLDEVWEIHTSKLYDNQKLLSSHMKFCYSTWRKEYLGRIDKKSITHFRNNNKELRKKESIYRIAQSNLKTRNKIEKIQFLDPNISTKELCKLLDKEKGIICRHNREINNKSTLISA